MTTNNISSSSTTSSAAATFSPIGSNNLSLLPPHKLPWTYDARLALYKQTPPRYLTHPSLEDGLIKKRPGRPPSHENGTISSKNSKKKRGVVGDGAPSVLIDGASSSKKQNTGSNSRVGSSTSNDVSVDPSRTMQNKPPARRSRSKTEQYIESLHKQIETEKQNIADLTPKVNECEKVSLYLKNENSSLNQSTETTNMIKMAREAEYMEAKKEIDNLVIYLNLSDLCFVSP
ncbi:hypothetical protein LINPERHAP1_LOCUS11982 [Linum perenne]